MIVSADIDGYSLHGGSNGAALIQIDLGSPSPRSVALVRPHQHGAIDQTIFYGPRVVEVVGQISAATKASLWSLLDDLKGTLALGSTHTFTFTREGNTYAEKMNVRVDSSVNVGIQPGMVQPYLIWGVTLFAEDPRFYDATTSSGSYDPTTSGSGGLLFDLDFDLEFGGDPSATLDVTNEGNISTPPIFTITGPVTNPIIDNDSLGKSIYTTGTSLTSTDSLVINIADRTCLLNGTTNRPDLIDASTTDWFELAPGVNQLRMRGTGMSSGQTELAVSFSSARI